MAERRSSQRLRAYLPARLSQGGGAVETLTKDISVGGVRCLSSALVPVRAEVTIEITLPTTDEVVVARGRTVWLQILPDSDQFDLGIAFLEISDKSKRLLSTYFELSSRLTPH